MPPTNFVQGLGPLTIDFAGEVVRIEPDGFGIIKFDNPIGPSANDHGFFSSSTSTSVPFSKLSPGVRVIGTAEAGKTNVASIKTVQLILPSA